ncbi:hypothetical protein L1887_43384 [Cichorium endivia]|nr:hypothetical protein L1887_43384 [Cichorium endivia]
MQNKHIHVPDEEIQASNYLCAGEPGETGGPSSLGRSSSTRGVAPSAPERVEPRLAALAPVALRLGGPNSAGASAGGSANGIQLVIRHLPPQRPTCHRRPPLRTPLSRIVARSRREEFEKNAPIAVHPIADTQPAVALLVVAARLLLVAVQAVHACIARHLAPRRARVRLGSLRKCVGARLVDRPARGGVGGRAVRSAISSHCTDELRECACSASRPAPEPSLEPGADALRMGLLLMLAPGDDRYEAARPAPADEERGKNLSSPRS